MKKKLLEHKWFSIGLWIVILIAAWEIGASVVEVTKRTPENILPHLSGVVKAAFSTKPTAGKLTPSQVVLTSAGATLLRALLGYALGAVIGYILAILMKLSGIIEKMIFPYLMLIQLIPVIGLAPIILATTGSINQSRVIISAILSFFPVATNTLEGMKAVPREKYDLMHIYAAPKWMVYTKVLIPSSKPYLFTGLKTAAPMAITASILVDTLQGDGGLGCMLSQSLKHAMNIYVFWLIVFFCALLGILSSYVIGWIQLLVTPSMRAERRSRRPKRRKMQKREKGKEDESYGSISIHQGQYHQFAAESGRR